MKLTDHISPADLEDLFNDLVMGWNRKVNLVSRRKTDVYDLIEDSKLFLNCIEFQRGIKIMDLGTGGGFPGIIMKIHHPEIQLTVVDSIAKKVKAVQDIISKLGLEGVDAVCARAEDMAKLPQYKNKFDYIVARSVAALDKLLKWSNGLIKPGGQLVAIKGGDINRETAAATKLGYIKRINSFDYKDKTVITIEII